MLLSIPLERYENVLVLPDHLPEQRYVICQADDANCWHILSIPLNNLLLQRLVATVEPSDQQRLHLILQGTYQELERQGNLLLLPENLINSKPGSQYVLTLAKKPTNPAC